MTLPPSSEVEEYFSAKRPELTAEQRLRLLEVGFRMTSDQTSELSVLLHSLKDKIDDTQVVNQEVKEILVTAKAGLRVLGILGTGVRWCGYIAAAGAAIYTFWYLLIHGHPPKL